VGHRPRHEHAVALEAQVPVQPARVVLVDDEPRLSRALFRAWRLAWLACAAGSPGARAVSRLRTRRLGGAREVAFRAIACELAGGFCLARRGHYRFAAARGLAPARLPDPPAGERFAGDAFRVRAFAAARFFAGALRVFAA